MKWLVVLISLYMLVSWYKSMSILESTRGLRNRNPGNIKEFTGDGVEWVGERATDDDPIFEEFNTFEEGIRAMGRILRSYRRRGITTIAQIIKTWAPSLENNTSAYIRSVEQSIGVPADYDIGDAELPEIVAAIIYHENGVQPFSQSFIKYAVNLP